MPHRPSARTPVRRALTAAVPLLLVGAFTLSGCGADEGPQPLATGKASPSPSETPSPTPTLPAGVQAEPPAVPGEQAETVASAQAYGEYVAHLVDYMSESRDVTVFDDQVADAVKCKGCTVVEKYATGLAGKGEYTRGADLKITRSIAQAVPGDKGVFQAVTLFDYPTKDRLRADGTVVDKNNGKTNKFACLTTMVWQDDAWKIRDFDFREASGEKLR